MRTLGYREIIENKINSSESIEEPSDSIMLASHIHRKE